jgi:predicted HicB family RNase H-like nuclease
VTTTTKEKPRKFSRLIALRLPEQLHEAAVLRAMESDMTLSQLVRRAVRRELTNGRR